MNLPATRGGDRQGQGFFGASRAGGTRKHNGVDFIGVARPPAMRPGDEVLAFLPGKVTKIGWPYASEKLRRFRYIEITRSNGDRLRYHYVNPKGYVEVGNHVAAYEAIGKMQKLPYAGITQHYHFEVFVGGRRVDPIKYLSGI